MFLELAQVLALLAFAWAVGKIQIDVNKHFDGRIDEVEKKQAVLLETQKYLIDMLESRMESFEQQFNYMKASLNACINKDD